MINFRQKEFNEGQVKRAVKFIKKNPTLPLAAASLGVAGANLKINTKRQKEARELSNKQLEMMGKQMDIIKANTNAINDSIKAQHEIRNAYMEDIAFRKKIQEDQQKENPKRKSKSIFKKFFPKENNTSKTFSIKSATIAGAQLGMGLGTLGASSDKITKMVGSKPIFNKIPGNKKGPSIEQRMSLVAAGTIIGAALGALVGTIGEIDKRIHRRSINDRLMPKVISNLKKDNLKEGVSYTRDPKKADELRTRVCLAVSRNSGDLRVLINTKSDPKLRDLTNYIVTHIPNAGVVNRSASNKFNEIIISTVSDNSADATLVSGIAEQFIHSGFPVYLVEVG